MTDIPTPRDTTFGTLEERHDALWKRVEDLERELANAEERERELLAVLCGEERNIPNKYVEVEGICHRLLGTSSISAFERLGREKDKQIAKAEHRAKAAEEDAERLLFLVREDIGIDQIGDLDIHAQAAEHAAIKGHDEPTDDDYIASIRTAIDAARKKDAA